MYSTIILLFARFVSIIKYLMRIMYKEQPKIVGVDSIENYLSKMGGGLAPPKLAGGKPHDSSTCILNSNCQQLAYSTVL